MWNKHDILSNDIASKFEDRMFCNFGGGGTPGDVGGGQGGYGPGVSMDDLDPFGGTGPSVAEISSGRSTVAGEKTAAGRQDDGNDESVEQMRARVAMQQAAQDELARVAAQDAINANRGNMGLVQGRTGIDVPGVYGQAQMGRPFASGFLQPNLTMGMMTSSGIRGIGQIPKAPVYNPATNTYTIDGQIIDNATAEYIMDVRGDVYGAVADPSAGLLGGFASKLGEMLTGQTDPVQGLGNYGKLLNMGGEIDPATGDIEAKVGKGTLNYNNRLGIVTYSGPSDPNYEGEFEQLVRGPFSSDDGDDAPAVPVTAITPAEEPVAAAVTPQYMQPAGGFYPSQGLYYRRGLLDEPVPGLLDFTARNRAFRRGMATDASLYQMPYDLTGYTLL